MKTVGQILSEARNAKGITFAEAERATKIRPEILQAIEEDNFSEIPGPTYIRGFIKNYGDFLGLPQDHLQAIFRRQYEEVTPRTGSFLPNFSAPESPKLMLTPGRALGLGVSVLVLGFMGYLLAQYQSFAAAPLISLSEPSDNLRTASGTVQVVGRTDRDAKLRINGQEVSLTESGAFSVSVTLPDGTTELTLSAENKLGRITAMKRTVTVETARSSEPAGPAASSGAPLTPALATASAKPSVAAAVTEAQLEVTLKIGPQSAWVRVESDATSFEGILGAGVSKTFKAQDKITVRTGNGGSTEVILGGVSQGLMGEPAQVVTKTFTR
ncbi:MAG TPA: RodZ domain-containing protein [Patescibacteria group bacterium]|nr:RodZ domain-containing protein [Patescibacteria group bacterium]